MKKTINFISYSIFLSIGLLTQYIVPEHQKEKMCNSHSHSNCSHPVSPRVRDIFLNQRQRKLPDYHIIIRPLGNVDQAILEYASDIVKEFYGFDCSIGNFENIDNDMFYKRNTNELDADVCIDKLKNQAKKTVFLSNLPLKREESELRGYAIRNGMAMLVQADYSFIRETLIHEIGHSLGLAHCSDLTCVMAQNNDQYDSGTFCSICSQKIGYNPPKNTKNVRPVCSGPDYYER